MSFIVEVMDFEFMSTDDMMFEEKSSKFGNTGFYYKGFEYTPPKESIYDRKPSNHEHSNCVLGEVTL